MVWFLILHKGLTFIHAAHGSLCFFYLCVVLCAFYDLTFRQACSTIMMPVDSSGNGLQNRMLTTYCTNDYWTVTITKYEPMAAVKAVKQLSFYDT